MAETFEDILLRLLGEHDRSQYWLAERIDVHRATVGRWINDPKARPASPEMVKKIARAFDLDQAQTLVLLSAAFALREPKHLISPGPKGDAALSSLTRPHFTEDASPLVGREAELARLQSCLASAQEGLTRMALVVGEAGIGKTRLVQEFFQFL